MERELLLHEVMWHERVARLMILIERLNRLCPSSIAVEQGSSRSDDWLLLLWLLHILLLFSNDGLLRIHHLVQKQALPANFALQSIVVLVFAQTSHRFDLVALL